MTFIKESVSFVCLLYERLPTAYEEDSVKLEQEWLKRSPITSSPGKNIVGYLNSSAKTEISSYLSCLELSSELSQQAPNNQISLPRKKEKQHPKPPSKTCEKYVWDFVFNEQPLRASKIKCFAFNSKEKNTNSKIV
ncbi:hypothetical protein AVEN_199421-1 [Araneus ventricosus]|uniref:Uncharacterized protein n=1 Tax=Araneus ventricosus TaxID=182803 RepID=A0A4Y2S7L6_ARAVE|nr:hypothetical protein AVEN_142205-1 [Araneus ventricosus]GBN84172.1 hypothetical protein AVEN_199421-1 [Araneus ventricosus]